MKILASQFRAARGLLGVDQEVVAAWAGLDRRELSRWEAAKYKLFSDDAENLTNAFKEHGVEFFAASHNHGAGVRWLKPGLRDRHRGIQFRAARAMANLSMRDLEDSCGASRSFITRLERGKLGALNLVTLKKMESAFVKLKIEFVPEEDGFGAGVRWMVSDPYATETADEDKPAVT
ncbi:transcriptional regulator [Agrobacterium rhizogenes]|uniref:helix-turn-helix domain-containing protein n=1 Tax=Rhizobium rhizogenes TaxID=359 RepID=UPI001574C900|nr:helix-turn-helix transcriptional regulator [Rhizobium rhizogenes]NTI16070.1 transcriptional regulator [Rhizobium rhizogenes]